MYEVARGVLAAIDDEIVAGTLQETRAGKSYVFENRYLSTGGQLYELIMEHDRFLADLCLLLQLALHQRGLEAGLCCHPYDLCTELIAREAGAIITNEADLSPDAPLGLSTDVAWIGYANTHIRDLVTPLLQ